MTVKRTIKLIEARRRQAGELENAVIDEFLSGRIDRRAFLRYAAVLGFAAPYLSHADRARAEGAVGSVVSGGLVTVGMPVPAGRVEAVTVGDTGRVWMLSQGRGYLGV